MRQRPWASSVLSGLALGLAAACTGGPPDTPYPTDAELVERLTAHRAAFDSLLAGDFRPELMGELGFFRRIDNSSGEEILVTLVAWGRDLVGPGGCEKGYAYRTTPPWASSLVDSLGADLARCGPEELELYRPVEGNWYLYYKAAN